ncbi:MAG: FprA family A-type flavoprotein [Candidatus Thermoplasmatota archaeon]|nr:FprA family A-type flavoprotein [Candidatus Thermoplasmatota archaeon]
MAVKELLEDIFEVGASHYDRELFDELIPLPDGTSYNAYLIKGSKKTALLDTVDPKKTERLFQNLESAEVEEIDYLIAHHAEQDHSGSIPDVLEKYPEATVVTNSKCKDMLIDHLHLSEEDILVIENEEELSLGDKTLKFIDMPWVHWPETLVTYLKEENVLFSCDFFGSHLATSNLFVQDKKKVYLAAKRYYAEIMMPFRSSIKNHLEKIDEMEVDIIATSHGPIYDDPDFILDAYSEWVNDETKSEVVIPYVSMHGSTDKMVEYFVDYLIQKDMKVKPFNLTTTDLGQLAMSLVDASTVVLGTPTVLVGAHPKAIYAAHLVNALRPKTRYASIIGSYGWGGRMPDQIKNTLSNFDGEFLEPVISKGHPGDEDFDALEELADKIIEKHEQDDLVS